MNTLTPAEKPLYPQSGKDEMNLTEFPFALLNARDSREVIEYDGWVYEDGHRLQQKWAVRGASGLGLPSEFGERILMALLSLTAESQFSSRKVTFSIAELIRRLDLGKGKRQYKLIEQQLDRLVGITIQSENAFWDHEHEERVTTQTAFHLIDSVWLRHREGNRKIKASEDANGFIIWGERVWNSFTAGYIKNLNLDFYYRLPTPLSRRLFRFLDKRMKYQKTYEIDIFDLSNRLGCVRYDAPSQVKRIMMPACETLIEAGFLANASVVKHKKYTRIRFEKVDDVVAIEEASRSAENALLIAASQIERGDPAAGDDELAVDPIWSEVLDHLKLQMPEPTYDAWLKNTYLLRRDGDCLVVKVASEQAKSWLDHRLNQVVEQTIKRFIDDGIVEFVVSDVEV